MLSQRGVTPRYVPASVIAITPAFEHAEGQAQFQKRETLSDSLALFDSLINSRWFLRTSFVLLLTKFDIFRKKLPRVSLLSYMIIDLHRTDDTITIGKDPLERYFPDYAGGGDVTQASKFILSKFMQKNLARLSIYSS